MSIDVRCVSRGYCAFCEVCQHRQQLRKNAENKLKIPWLISREGSSPSVRTNNDLTMLLAISFIDTAAAQVVIPHGDFDNGFEDYLVAAVTVAVLIFAMWRYFRNK
jgi:hypothetical protein